MSAFLETININKSLDEFSDKDIESISLADQQRRLYLMNEFAEL